MGKKRGWYLYQRQAVTVLSPFWVRVICAKCTSTATTRLVHKDDDSVSFGCHSCGHLTPDSEDVQTKIVYYEEARND